MAIGIDLNSGWSAKTASGKMGRLPLVEPAISCQLVASQLPVYGVIFSYVGCCLRRSDLRNLSNPLVCDFSDLRNFDDKFAGDFWR